MPSPPMKPRLDLVFVGAALLACTPPAVTTRSTVLEPVAPPEPGCHVFTNARLLTAADDPAQRELRGAWLRVVDGRIAALGSGQPEATPGCVNHDVGGATITPGIIDTHSHLGVYPWPSATAHADGNEMTSPVTPDVRALDSVWPQDPGFERALRGGVTALQVLPGSGNLIGGMGVTLRPLRALSATAMRFPGAPRTLKMACGENPKRVYGTKGSAPMTRMGNLRGQRRAFIEAREKQDATDLASQTLRAVMAGTILVQVHCYRADEMLSFLELAQELGFKVRSFHHAVEAYKIAKILAREDVSVSTWADWWGFKLESWDGIPENAAFVHAAGGRAVIHSDSAIGIQRLNQEAAKALAFGRRAGLELADGDAIRWLTANPAWTLGIEHETGQLAPGRRADLDRKSVV